MRCSKSTSPVRRARRASWRTLGSRIRRCASSLKADVAQIAALPGLHLRGLMTMAPIVADAELARPVFASLAALRAALAESLHLSLPDLSMGMTDDYPVAIEEGATLVRVGRAIFGQRERV